MAPPIMKIPHITEIGITVAVRSGTEVTVPPDGVTLWCGPPPPGGGVITASVASAAETLHKISCTSTIGGLHLLMAADTHHLWVASPRRWWQL
jgi:hypothetical protein